MTHNNTKVMDIIVLIFVVHFVFYASDKFFTDADIWLQF